MNQEWISTISKLVNKSNDVPCPICGEPKLDYIYIADEETRVGYLQIWCRHCLNGTYVSRVKVPKGAKMLTFEQTEEQDRLIPDYTFIEE